MAKQVLPVVVALVVILGSTTAAAQGAPPSQAQVAAVGTSEPAPPEQVDVFDLLRRVRHKVPPASAPVPEWDFRKPMLAVVPTIGSKPSTGVTIGAASNVAVFFGDPATTHISSAVLGVSVSTKKQTVITARFSGNGPNDRLRIDGDNRFQWTSQDTYGLGSQTGGAEPVNARFTYTRVYETAFFKLRPGLFAGVGVHFSAHTNVRPDVDDDPQWEQSPFVVYSLDNGLPLDSQTSAGPSLNLLVDTRDNPINASRGWLAGVSFRPFFKDVLGSDSAWQEVIVDVRTFVKLTPDGRKRLAFWVYGDVVVDGAVPYFDLPALGMDTYGRSGQGYTEGRFRGERLMYGEVEYRAALTRNGLLGMVVFANTTTVANLQDGQHLFDDFAPAGGAGLRVSFNKRSKTNLCLDYAWGTHGSHGLYLGLQEAF